MPASLQQDEEHGRIYAYVPPLPVGRNVCPPLPGLYTRTLNVRAPCQSPNRPSISERLSQFSSHVNLELGLGSLALLHLLVEEEADEEDSDYDGLVSFRLRVEIMTDIAGMKRER